MDGSLCLKGERLWIPFFPLTLGLFDPGSHSLGVVKVVILLNLPFPPISFLLSSHKYLGLGGKLGARMTNWFAPAILLLAPQTWNTSRTPSVSSKQTVVHPGPHFILQTKLCIPTQPLMEWGTLSWGFWRLPQVLIAN